MAFYLFRLSSGDVAGFKLLFSLAIIYGMLSTVAYYVTHMKFITPLGIDAPLDRFSEARAIEHIRVLAHEIDGRQVNVFTADHTSVRVDHIWRQGLHDAAKYIQTQLEMLKDRAGSNVRIEIEQNVVNGSFNMMFLGHSLSLGYRNHTNIVMRISSLESKDTDPSILLNGHFDSPPGSPGAGDCGSCVASILEIARLTIDSGWVPPKPLIFLFNGAEELFMLGSHGFITTHKWVDTIGAFINLEASGTGGLDFVCQSGPGSWPSQVYAESAVHPMGNSAAQDIFGFVPGDTDYRMFATDFGEIPGLDIILLHGGYFYHTTTDTVERLLYELQICQFGLVISLIPSLPFSSNFSNSFHTSISTRPGSIQARGDNLVNLVKAFTVSPHLKTAFQRRQHPHRHDHPMFFDYVSWFLVYYSRAQGLVYHGIPVAIFLVVPFVLRFSKFGLLCSFAALFDNIKGILFHLIGIIFGVIFPVIFSILRLLFCGQSMNWFAHPYLAYMMFVPCSLAGMLFPRFCWNYFPLSQPQATYLATSSKQEVIDESRFWGAFGLYALISMVYFTIGLSGGFLTLSLAALMLPAWIFFHLSHKYCGRQSLWSAASFLLPTLPVMLHSVYFSVFLVQFIIEKMGMMGSLPLPHGYFVPDVIVAAIIGALTGICVGPILPVTGHWLARSSIMQFLLHATVIAMALTSQFFPYSINAPKRVILQHTIVTTETHIDEISYDISVLDSNALPFLFKHAPQLSKELKLDSANHSYRESWMAIYPLSDLFSRSLKFPARRDEISNNYKYFPHVSKTNQEYTFGDGSRRIYLEFSLGSLKEVWVTVLNITGPISGWSFANSTLPAPEIVKGAPPSYICRLSGVAKENWTFWVETNSPGDIRIEVGVVEQYLMESMKKLKDSFPEWVDVIAFSSFLSTYIF
ncbi:hypothetical protein LXL04_020655 [Taraxacum kok-saghyz]